MISQYVSIFPKQSCNFIMILILKFILQKYFLQSATVECLTSALNECNQRIAIQEITPEATIITKF